MNDSTVYVGLGAHKDSNVTAYAIGSGEVRNLGNVGVRKVASTTFASARAHDGHQHCGTQPAHISMSHRRMYWLRRLQGTPSTIRAKPKPLAS